MSSIKSFRGECLSGLLLIGAAAIWIGAIWWFGRKLGVFLASGRWRIVVRLSIFLLLLPLPLIDEVVGGWQFSKLCGENSVYVSQNVKRGRTVYREIGPQVLLTGLWVRAWKYPFKFLDAATGEILVSFDQLSAEGGRLFPGFDSGRKPLIFKGECHPTKAFDKNFVDGFGLHLVEKAAEKN